MLFFNFKKYAFSVAAVPLIFTSSLHLGSKSPEVTALQTRLKAEGLLTLPSDATPGYFGQLTKLALIQFQTAHGLEAVGTVGPKTRDVLNGTKPPPAKFSVSIVGGFDTDPRDLGRPVPLFASALGVPTDIFRKAYLSVTPDDGSIPDPAQDAINKAGLIRLLSQYNITINQLDQVFNYYHFDPSSTDEWQRKPATAEAIVTDGVVTGFTITNPGSGYTSAPTIVVTGVNNLAATAQIFYGSDLSTNGSISAITLAN